MQLKLTDLLSAIVNGKVEINVFNQLRTATQVDGDKMSLCISIKDTHLDAWETGDWDSELSRRFYDEANSWLASFLTANNHYTGIAHLISVNHLPKEQLEEIAKKLQEMYDNLQAEFLAKEIHGDEEYEA